MKRKIIFFVLIIIFSILLWFSKYLLSQDAIGICQGGFLCESFWFRGVLWPLHESLLYLIVSMIPFILLPFSFLKIWLKIIIPYFIIAIFFIISTPEVCSGIICFDRTLVASGFAKLFLILTILIIIGKSIHLFVISKKKNNVKK